MFDEGIEKFYLIESKKKKKNQKQRQFNQIRLEEIRSELT